MNSECCIAAEFEALGNAAFLCLTPATSVSPANQYHHWHFNAETYYEIAESLGNDMKGLLE
jgi:hypothetical protein